MHTMPNLSNNDFKSFLNQKEMKTDESRDE
jgi:hypothetical protein